MELEEPETGHARMIDYNSRQQQEDEELKSRFDLPT